MAKYDEGFARNIRKIFGPGDLYDGFAGRKLKSVILSNDKETIAFEFQDGYVAKFGAEGDCCSTSWIEHLTVPDDIEGQELVEAIDECIGTEDVPDGYTYRQVYQTKLRTDKGETITIEYRNDSNGYYGGYLVRLEN